MELFCGKTAVLIKNRIYQTDKVSAGRYVLLSHTLSFCHCVGTRERKRLVPTYRYAVPKVRTQYIAPGCFLSHPEIYSTSDGAVYVLDASS